MPAKVGLSRPNYLGLYYFISKLLPGISLLIGVLFFIPNSQYASVVTTSNIMFILVLGYPTGQFIHSLSEMLDDFFPDRFEFFYSHREYFREQINEMGDDDLFVLAFNSAYNSSILDTDTDTAYTLVRSSLEINGGCRSSQFQALRIFSRSMFAVTLMLVFLSILSVIAGNITDYKPYLENIISVQWMFLLFVPAVVFYYGNRFYKNRYIEYMFADFVNIENLAESELERP